jgi:DNA-binding response OmpR family regulator
MTNVLIVEDDTELADMVTMLLNRAGMCVRSIDKGNLLFDALDGFKPDIILMDIYLGEDDGRTLCRAVKTNELLRVIPVILYSASHITTGSIRESMADAFISKPFETEKLLEKIRFLVKLKGK